MSDVWKPVKVIEELQRRKRSRFMDTLEAWRRENTYVKDKKTEARMRTKIGEQCMLQK